MSPTPTKKCLCRFQLAPGQFGKDWFGKLCGRLQQAMRSLTCPQLRPLGFPESNSCRTPTTSLFSAQVGSTLQIETTQKWRILLLSRIKKLESKVCHSQYVYNIYSYMCACVYMHFHIEIYMCVCVYVSIYSGSVSIAVRQTANFFICREK